MKAFRNSKNLKIILKQNDHETMKARKELEVDRGSLDWYTRWEQALSGKA